MYIPGFGIDHDPQNNIDHNQIHKTHRKLVLDALKKVQPLLQLDDQFRNLFETDFRKGSDVHLDLAGHISTHTRQIMTLKLHTTGLRGANVVVKFQNTLI